MTTLSLLDGLEREFGDARIITRTSGIRDIKLQSEVQVRRINDAWRPLANVKFLDDSDPTLTPHFNASLEDITRAERFFR